MFPPYKNIINIIENYKLKDNKQKMKLFDQNFWNKLKYYPTLPVYIVPLNFNWLLQKRCNSTAYITEA